MINVAILVDGTYFLKRYRTITRDWESQTPEKIASVFYNKITKHVKENEYLYRILFYDCTPLEKSIHHPLTKQVIKFAQTREAVFRKAFYDELKKKRKLALRLSEPYDQKFWAIKPDVTKDLLNKKKQFDELTENDILYSVKQRGVDVKIATDITYLALKQKVQKIILVAGDSDFVPAAKVARREGIDFVLDPMWNEINSDLYEHIDGLSSVFTKPVRKQE